MTTWLIVLKYTGGFFAACYGIYATLTDFRVKKDGKKVLSKKGYFGIGLLALGSVLSLSADGYKDYNELWEKTIAAENELATRNEARARDDRITARLTDQLGRLEKLRSTLGRASAKLDHTSKTTEGISNDLGVELKATSDVSNQLGDAVISLNRTSETTNSVLEETVDRIDSLDVHLEIVVDPLAITDASGKSILSSESLRLLEEDKNGTIDLFADDDLEKVLIKDFQANYKTLRNSVFSNWSAGLTLDVARSEHDLRLSNPILPKFRLTLPNMIYVVEGDSSVANFLIAGFSNDVVTINQKHKGYKALLCDVVYSVPPNRYVGIRKFDDLNGAKWTVSLQTDGDLLQLNGALLSVGGAIGGPLLEMSDSEIKTPERGLYEGSTTIPEHYFKGLSRNPVEKNLQPGQRKTKF